MALGILKEYLLKSKKNNDYKVFSAGLNALVGQPADPLACQLLIKKGVDISAHRASQIDLAMIRNAELILVMELNQKQFVEKYDPSSRGKVYRLGEWGGFDVKDPYRQDIKVFEESLDLIEKGISQWLQRL